MTNSKRHWRNIWTKLKKIHAWYLVIGFVCTSILSAVALRQNNLNALHLRDVVIQTDQDNGDVEARLHDLRTYIYSHMNAQLSTGPNAIRPPIQLKYRYERLLAAEKARVSAINTAVYAQAQTICEQLSPHGISGAG